MKEATLIYPHQLFEESKALKKGRCVYLIEEALILSHNPIHRQKLLFHKLSMDAYEELLISLGYEVRRLSILEYPTTKDVFDRIKKDGIRSIHVVDTTDDFLEKALRGSRLERVWYESPLFLLEKADAIKRYESSKRFMANFYKKLRKDKKILLQKNGEPVGGEWSFDDENRKKLPKTIKLPKDIALLPIDVKPHEKWLKGAAPEQYGEIGCWLPVTHQGAKKFFSQFLQERFEQFGPYEDALSERGGRLFHSTLSPLINVGLLTPEYVLDEAIRFAKANSIPINSLEGFVRQILGWREFIRAAYECDHVKMRTKNFWRHKRPLPKEFWTGKTNIKPIDLAIQKALLFGYNHHIERLMVLGNFMLLSQIDPDDVYKWFMSMYLDAYDWVMVPNVYGMSQFADGGIFATKPYISGSNYIRKMSDYPSGDWEEIWTALYWNFVSTNRPFFTENQRLSMMPKMLDKMDAKQRKTHFEMAKNYLS